MVCRICLQPQELNDDNLCSDCDALYGPCDVCQKPPKRGKDELTGCEIDTTPAKVTPIPPQRRAVILYNGETNYWEAWEDGQNQPAFLRNAISDHIGAVSHLVQRCMLAKFDVIEIHTNH